MLTRSVVACMVSGTLVSSVFPGYPLVSNVHAEELAAKKAARMSRQERSIQRTGVTVPREQLSSLPRDIRLASIARSETTVPVFSTEQPSRSSATHLGTFTVRAYTHYHRPGTRSTKTATGTVPATGRTVAVDPLVIPLGSKILIEGVGERIAEDTGGKIRGKRLDLFLPSVKECRQFGVRAQEVHLLPD